MSFGFWGLSQQKISWPRVVNKCSSRRKDYTTILCGCCLCWVSRYLVRACIAIEASMIHFDSTFIDVCTYHGVGVPCRPRLTRLSISGSTSPDKMKVENQFLRETNNLFSWHVTVTTVCLPKNWSKQAIRCAGNSYFDYKLFICSCFLFLQLFFKTLHQLLIFGKIGCSISCSIFICEFPVRLSNYKRLNTIISLCSNCIGRFDFCALMY